MSKELKEFLTVVYEYYNHYNSRVSEKKIELFSTDGKGKSKKEYFPPTAWDVFSLSKWEKIQKKEFLNWFWEVPLMEPSEEFKNNNSKNLARQDEVMETIALRHEKFNYDCGLIVAGTGVWKSVIAIKICKYFEGNALILVSNKKLLYEMHDRFFQLTGMKVWIYWDGKKEIDPITICTKKSFSLDFEEICKPENRFETIVVDECHMGFSDAFRFALNKGFDQKNVHLYGMSATPFTPELEVEDFEKYFGRKIDVKDEYDYTPDFEIIDYKPASILVKGQESEWYVYEDYAELRGLMAEDQIRFEHQFTKLKQLFASRKNILVLTDRIIESEQYYDRLAKWDMSKFNLIKITGETDPKDDERLVKESIENGKKTIIVWSIQKIGTGFDYPPGDTVFIVSAIKWKSSVEQAVGRVLRKYDKPNPLVVIWNDDALRGQKAEKEKTIKKVYWVQKSDILFTKIWDHRELHEKMKIDFVDITQT